MMKWNGRWPRIENLHRGEEGEESFAETEESFLVIGAQGHWSEPEWERSGSGTASDGAFTLRAGDRLERLEDDRVLRDSGGERSIYEREPDSLIPVKAVAVSGFRVQPKKVAPTVGKVRQALRQLVPEDPATSDPDTVVVDKQKDGSLIVGLRWPVEMKISKKWVAGSAGLDDMQTFAFTLTFWPQVLRDLKLKPPGALTTWASSEVFLGREVSAAPQELESPLQLVHQRERLLVGFSLMAEPGFLWTPRPGNDWPPDVKTLWPNLVTQEILDLLAKATEQVAVSGRGLELFAA